MKIFIDSARLDEIKQSYSYGIIDGVTTNPSLLKKAVLKLQEAGEKITIDDYIKKILTTAKGTPVSLEVTEFAADGMINCTLIFTPEQALLAAKAGAKFVSPFAGRVDDYIRDINNISFKKSDYFPAAGLKADEGILEDNGVLSGIDLIEQIIEVFRNYNIKTEVLAASIRNVRQAREAALIGADIATLPFGVIRQLRIHSKTQEGMKKFTNNWYFF